MFRKIFGQLTQLIQSLCPKALVWTLSPFSSVIFWSASLLVITSGAHHQSLIACDAKGHECIDVSSQPMSGYQQTIHVQAPGPSGLLLPSPQPVLLALLLPVFVAHGYLRIALGCWSPTSPLPRCVSTEPEWRTVSVVGTGQHTQYPFV